MTHKKQQYIFEWPKDWLNRLMALLATGLGTGFLPKAPGTFGSLSALPLCWWLAGLAPLVAMPVWILIVAISIISAHITQKNLGADDPSFITIDEVAGMATAFMFHEFTAISACFLFLLFRLFDILKPFPVKQLENSLSGGLGVVMDDVAAGVLANLVWTGVLLIQGWFL